MRWPFSLGSKVGTGFYNSAPEEHLPETVDRDPAGEWMIRPHQPAGQIQPVEIAISWNLKRREECRNAWFDCLTLVRIKSPLENMSHPWFLRGIHHHNPVICSQSLKSFF